MEENMEKRVWQRVRGEPDRVEALRGCLARQGRLWSIYRNLGRRGGKCRMLFEQKENQIACLRGLLRVLTGQGVQHPRCGECQVDLLEAFAAEQQLLEELTGFSREPGLGPVFAALAEGQKKHLRILLEIIGTM